MELLGTSVELASSAFARVAYDEPNQSLRVEFRDGSVYSYAGVPAGIYRELIGAESHGASFNRRIRSVFPAIRQY